MGSDTKKIYIEVYNSLSQKPVQYVLSNGIMHGYSSDKMDIIIMHWLKHTCTCAYMCHTYICVHCIYNKSDQVHTYTYTHNNNNNIGHRGSIIIRNVCTLQHCRLTIDIQACLIISSAPIATLYSTKGFLYKLNPIASTQQV